MTPVLNLVAAAATLPPIPARANAKAAAARGFSIVVIDPLLRSCGSG